MKRLIAIVSTLCILSFGAVAQVGEFGFGVGTSNFLGDLGKKSPKMKNYFGDLSGSMFRPSVQVFYRHTFNPRIALKGSLSYGQIAGDDRLSNTTQHRDDGWYRSYRNLHFKSFLLEFSVTAEFHILKYYPGSLKHRWTPFISGGVALFAFNPKAEYNGQWVALQPLGTEGQGLPQYPDRQKYSLVQPSIPLGFGVKYNINRALCLTFEAGHRITFTDYMDDVSQSYVGRDEFFDYYGAERAQMVYQLSRRSPEIDPEGSYASITDKGNPRGNPTGNDGYLFSMVTLSYNFNKNNRKEYNPFAKKAVKKYKRIMR
ncbi:MAG: DUF6089 family protein [Chitinophagales bacterium]|nr:DUF6089 family protein [Chitinophagales bacterium]